jgi:hypothetical protein
LTLGRIQPDLARDKGVEKETCSCEFATELMPCGRNLTGGNQRQPPFRSGSPMEYLRTLRADPTPTCVLSPYSI